MKTSITRAKPDAKAPRLHSASDVQIAAKGLGDRDHNVHPDVLGRISQHTACRQFERAKVTGSQPQVPVAILSQGQGSAAGQPVVFGPNAHWSSVGRKLSQTS